MARDYLTVLGLAPSTCDPAEVTRRYQLLRGRLLIGLEQPETSPEAQLRLEELHLAYAALRSRLARHAADASDRDDHRVAELRLFIEASIEDGLLRYSRRQAILSEARGLGFSDFQTHVLIAEVQFGGRSVLCPTIEDHPGSAGSHKWPFVAAAALLAGAMFLALVQWTN